MYTCPKCGFKYDEHVFDSCPRCHLPGRLPVLCENCGAELESGALVCPECKVKTAFGRKFDQALGKE